MKELFEHDFTVELLVRGADNVNNEPITSAEVRNFAFKASEHSKDEAAHFHGKFSVAACMHEIFAVFYRREIFSNEFSDFVVPDV